MVDKEQITTIAAKVRKECKGWARRNGRLSVSTKTLCGMCAVASYALWKTLTHYGIGSRFAMGYNHCWVELADSTIIDITATQFGVKEPVRIASYGDEYGWYQYDKANMYDDEAVRYIDNTWSDGQSPLKHLEMVDRIVRRAGGQ